MLPLETYLNILVRAQSYPIALDVTKGQAFKLHIRLRKRSADAMPRLWSLKNAAHWHPIYHQNQKKMWNNSFYPQLKKSSASNKNAINISAKILEFRK